jgi:hypothetical protein
VVLPSDHRTTLLTPQRGRGLAREQVKDLGEDLLLGDIGDDLLADDLVDHLPLGVPGPGCATPDRRQEPGRQLASQRVNQPTGRPTGPASRRTGRSTAFFLPEAQTANQARWQRPGAESADSRKQRDRERRGDEPDRIAFAPRGQRGREPRDRRLLCPSRKSRRDSGRPTNGPSTVRTYRRRTRKARRPARRPPPAAARPGRRPTQA